MVFFRLPSSFSGIVGLISAVAVVSLSPVYVLKMISSWYHRRKAVGCQSRLLPGPERIHESVLEYTEDCDQLDDCPVTTVYELFLRGVKISNNGSCLGYRKNLADEYQWLTYEDVLHRVQRLASAVLQLGVKPGNETFIGLYLKNRVEWVVSLLSFMSLSAVLVPLYENVNLESMQHIITQAGISLIVCDATEKVKKILSLSPIPSCLKHVILIDCQEIDDESKNKAAENEIQLHDFEELLKSGWEGYTDPALLPKPENVFTVCYTSGTTGIPKGAMIGHKHVVYIVKSLQIFFKSQGIYVSPEDSRLCYLPLGHVYELINLLLGFYLGCKLGFYSGEIRELMKDIRDLSPTVMPVVPRILNRFYEKVQLSLLSKPYHKFIFNTAIKIKQLELKFGIVRNNGITDNLVFANVHKEVGGKLHLITVGSAPMAPNVLTACRAMLGCIIVEGYGQTESSGPVTITLPCDTESGHVGAILPGQQVKLVDVPELEYYAKNDRGEICVRGRNTMIGYLHDLEKTEETLDENGWIHTGDIGEWRSNGSLKIIDRKKHIFKLCQGEYIAPEKIENVYSHCSLVAQIFVDGSSIQRYLVAIVVPEKEELLKWAKSQKIDVDFQSLCSKQEAIDYVLQELKNTGKQMGLNSLEQVKKIYLCEEAFTTGNGYLTPTFKNRRPVLRKKFAQVIENLYSS